MIAAVSPLDLALLDRWQRDFPLVPRPYAVLGAAHELSEFDAIARIADLLRRDLISRVGAVVRPNTAGASTLAAMAVPPERLEDVAERVSCEASVNHNYEREHRFNLWFVVAAANPAQVARILTDIEDDTGFRVLDLPLERAYHIDLGFPLSGASNGVRSHAAERLPVAPDSRDLALLQAMENGLPLEPRPFAALARRLACAERDVIARLARLLEGGVVSRFGLVVKHRSLGYRANAMAVWDVPDTDVDRVAASFVDHRFVTLCYRRPRRLPAWPYNLFCMVHGRDRAKVRDQIAALNDAAGTRSLPQAVLFSRRCFKQRGARFAAARAEAVA